MDRAWLQALSLFAATAIGCGGPGDHEMSAGLAHLFGGGTAGKPAPNRSTDPSDAIGDASAPSTSDVPMLPSSASSAGRSDAGPLASATAGSKAMPTDNAAAGTDAVSVSGPAGSSAGGTTAGTGSMTTDPEGPTCSAGYLAVAGQCVCDLNGTFAFHAKTPVSLASTPPIEALNDQIELWGIVRQNYDAQGNLELTLNSCGQTTADICASAQPPVLSSAEAYAQYVPVEVWDMPTPAAKAQLNFPGATPGAAFATPTLVQLFGVTLTNPLGAWPTTRKNVDGGPDFAGTATNGARWADTDADGKLGMTMKVVGPGGVTAGASSGPLHS